MTKRNQNTDSETLDGNRPIYDCAGIGMCVADYQCLLDHYPASDEKTELKKFIMQGGSPVPTALVALAKWKRKTAFVGIAGDDFDGRFIRDEMERIGVDTSFMVMSKRSRTPKAFVLIDGSTGSRTVVLDRTGIEPLPMSAASARKFPRCRVLHADGREAPAALAAMALARRRGGDVVMDAGSPRDRMEEFFAATDHFVASHSFVKKYFGPRVGPKAALGKILARGPRVAVVTLGENGCLGATRGGTFAISGHKKPGFVVDTTGAGDVFHGGYIQGLLDGWPPDRCARFANAAAFLSCGAIGARDGIPNLKQVLSLLKEIE
jgi:sulfofructose kinase